MSAEPLAAAGQGDPAEHEVVAALLALRHRAGRSPSAQAPEAAWRRTRLAALGLLPRFPEPDPRFHRRSDPSAGSGRRRNREDPEALTAIHRD